MGKDSRGVMYILRNIRNFMYQHQKKLEVPKVKVLIVQNSSFHMNVYLLVD